GAALHARRSGLRQWADGQVIEAPCALQLKGVIDADAIALMPPQSVLVNISRGDLVDDEALIAALASHRLFAAGLDVFANEPRIDARYRELDNVFLSPHIGSATRETRDAMGWLLIDGLDALYRGSKPGNLLEPH